MRPPCRQGPHVHSRRSRDGPMGQPREGKESAGPWASGWPSGQGRHVKVSVTKAMQDHRLGAEPRPHNKRSGGKRPQPGPLSP